MSVRTITHNVNTDRVPLDTVQYGGVRFEDNATSVQFVLDNEFKSKLEQKFENAKITYRIDFNGEISGYNPSENLTIIDNKVTRPIPLCMTSAGEQITAVLVATAIDSNGESIGTVSSVPIKIYFDNVSRDESGGLEIAENVSAMEQKTREICVLAKSFSDSASDSAATAAAAADGAIEAMIKTEESKISLENGAEFVFLGGDSKSNVNIDLAIDDAFSDVSENPVQNKVITEKLNGIADYIVEQGKKDTWTYRKWNSGIVECWGLQTFTDVEVNKVTGNGYYSDTLTVDLPFPITQHMNSFTTRNSGIWATQFGVNTDIIQVRVNSVASNTYSSLTMFFNVKGTWK